MTPDVARALETAEARAAIRGHQHGQVLRIVRQALGLSQAELGTLLGRWQATVSKWESAGIDSISTLRMLRDALDVPSDVLGLAEDRPAQSYRSELAMLQADVDAAFERLTRFYNQTSQRLAVTR